MEAIYGFEVVDMPVTVAVDAGGTSMHATGSMEWSRRIATGEFKNIAVAAAWGAVGGRGAGAAEGERPCRPPCGLV